MGLVAIGLLEIVAGIAVTALVLVVVLFVLVYRKLWHRVKKSRVPVHSGVVIVDGSNVAFHRVGKGKGRVKNIKIVVKTLEKKGFDVKVVIDASLRHRIDKPGELERLIREGKVIQAPPGSPADYFILKMAEDLNAVIVSNDLYRDWWKEFPWARGSGRIIRYIIEGKRAYFYPDIYPTRRARKKRGGEVEEEVPGEEKREDRNLTYM